MALAGLALLLLLAWFGTTGSPFREHSLDATAQRYVDDGLKRALVTFGTARTLNAVLSVAQGTEVAVEPGGVGVKLSPGQVLHPINQLVGQFAELMLAASVAFGAMEILIRVGSHWTVTVALTIVAVAWAAYRWRGEVAPGWIAKLLMIFIVLRFTLPIVSIGSEYAYRLFMADDYTQAQQGIQATSERIDMEAVAQADQKADLGFFDRLKDWVQRKTDVGTGVKRLVVAAQSVVEHVVKLICVFLLQTLVIPIILGWALLRGTAALVRVRSRSPTI